MESDERRFPFFLLNKNKNTNVKRASRGYMHCVYYKPRKEKKIKK